MIIVDGNKISAEIKKEVAAKALTLGEAPSLTIFYDEEDAVGAAYVKRKEAFAKDVGITFKKEAFNEDEAEASVVERIKQAGMNTDGIIVQLPTPERYNCETLLNAIPPDTDVDLVTPQNIQQFEAGLTRLMPPVVGAIKIIVDQFNVKLEDAHAVVVGEGRLVGSPAAIWLRKKGARVVTVTKATQDIQHVIKEANILVLGAGSPGLISPDMLKQDVAIFDAGATIVEGKVRGDAMESCAEKASLYTPVPGGLGPMGVACAYQNLLALAEEGRRNARQRTQQ